MASPDRPLSPFLIYRPQLTSVLSFLHRATGVGLTVGALVLVLWLAAAAAGPESYAEVMAFLSSPIGLILLVGWSASFFYHFCNGIRHLTWDAGYGFELAQAYASGWAVVIGAVLLTVLLWVSLALASGAG